MNPDVPKLVTTKPDTEMAEEFKKALIVAYAPVVEILERARIAGFVINVQCGPVPPFGHVNLAGIQIMKQFP